MTEKEKLAQGLWYDANYDVELIAERQRAEELCWRLGQTNPHDTAALEELWKQLLPYRGKDVSITLPFAVDYGYNCFIGQGTFINRNAYMMDGASIRLGEHCFIGPNCGFYTALHPLDAAERNQGLERALPITLGDNVWLGGGVTLLPGIIVGSGSVIGAGSVVTHDIPEGVVAYGNPCRVIRPVLYEV